MTSVRDGDGFQVGSRDDGGLGLLYDGRNLSRDHVLGRREELICQHHAKLFARNHGRGRPALYSRLLQAARPWNPLTIAAVLAVTFQLSSSASEIYKSKLLFCLLTETWDKKRGKGNFLLPDAYWFCILDHCLQFHQHSERFFPIFRWFWHEQHIRPVPIPIVTFHQDTFPIASSLMYHDRLQVVCVHYECRRWSLSSVCCGALRERVAWAMGCFDPHSLPYSSRHDTLTEAWKCGQERRVTEQNNISKRCLDAIPILPTPVVLHILTPYLFP